MVLPKKVANDSRQVAATPSDGAAHHAEPMRFMITKISAVVKMRIFPWRLFARDTPSYGWAVLRRSLQLKYFRLSSIRDHLAEARAKLTDGSMMDEIRDLIERARFAIDDRQQRAIALGRHGK